MSLMRRKRLEALEALARNRHSFKPGPPAEAVAASLRAALAEAELVRTGKACWLPQPVDTEPLSPAAQMVMANLDRIAAQFAAEADAAKQAKRAAKLERRRLRREQAAREGAREAVGTATIERMGSPSTPLPAPALASQVVNNDDAKPSPVSMASLRY